MALKDIRARHVYAASAAAFVLIAGFEGARMAAGHDPALAASRPAAAPTPAAQAPWRQDDHDRFAPGDQGGFAPGDQGGTAPGEVPQPESRLS
jgi:hypothetical protein